MLLIHPNSLVSTVDSTMEALFYAQSIPAPQQEQIGAFIISHQTVSGRNSGFFYSPASDNGAPLGLFSGERLTTQFAHRHYLLIENTRLLRLLRLDDVKVTQSIHLAEQRMNSTCYSKFCTTGECKTLSIAYMRYLALNPREHTGELLVSFLRILADHRDGKGKWLGFPYYYTLLVLAELNHPSALAELDYAVPHCADLLPQLNLSEPIELRRQAILSHVLSRN